MSSDKKRADLIVSVLDDAFAPLMKADPVAFRAKYRKMASDPHSFYRGSRVPVLRGRHRGRGRLRRRAQRPDLGPRRPARGELRHLPELRRPAGLRRQRLRRGLRRPVHVGPAAVRRLPGAAGLAEGAARRGRPAADRQVPPRLPVPGRRLPQERGRRRLRAAPRQHPTGRSRPRWCGPAAGAARTCSTTRRCSPTASVGSATTTPYGAWARTERREGRDGVRAVSRDDPGRQAGSTASCSTSCATWSGKSGFGIGSAGLPAYNLLVEGYSQALDNDVVLSMKQANIPAVSRFVDTEGGGRLLRARGAPHGGQPAGAPGAHRPDARPHQLDGVGYVVSEVSPYEVDLDWSGADRARRHRRASSSCSGGPPPRSTARPTRTASRTWSTSRSRRRSRRACTAGAGSSRPGLTDFGIELRRRGCATTTRCSSNAFREGRIGGVTRPDRGSAAGRRGAGRRGAQVRRRTEAGRREGGVDRMRSRRRSVPRGTSAIAEPPKPPPVIRAPSAPAWSAVSTAASSSAQEISKSSRIDACEAANSGPRRAQSPGLERRRPTSETRRDLGERRGGRGDGAGRRRGSRRRSSVALRGAVRRRAGPRAPPRSRPGAVRSRRR